MSLAVRTLQTLLVVAAAGLWWAPLPPQLVERRYAGWLYPAVQARLTSWSNGTAFALFDVLIGVLVAGALIAWAGWSRRAWRRRSAWPLIHGVVVTLVAASALYLWFAAAWGLNYARPPVESTLAFEPARITPEAVRALADRAGREVNQWYGLAYATGFPQRGDMPAPLIAALHEIEGRLGRPRPTVAGRPKRTVLGGFFRMAGVDGMHAPFLLETLLNPDLTPPERPAVLAHEWAHMSGYAPEDDASFVGLLAALNADAPSRYSGWLAVFEHAVNELPREQQRRVLALLQPGPRGDRQAIAERLSARVDLVARASWQTYDQYLKSQGVSEGVASYGRVLQLLIGTGAIEWR